MINKEELKKLLEEKNLECVFVETGTYEGHTVDEVLKLGLNEIRTIEASEYYYNLCKSKYENNDRVKLYYGSSRYHLYDMCKDIDSHIIFWLDAHYSGGCCFIEHGNERPWCPLYEELEQIKKLEKNNHTIMIDDIRLVGSDNELDVTLDEITKRIMDINPNYNLYYVHGYVPHDILIGKVP